MGRHSLHEPVQPQFEEPKDDDDDLEGWFDEDDDLDDYVPLQPPLNPAVHTETASSRPPNPTQSALRNFVNAPPVQPVERVQPVQLVQETPPLQPVQQVQSFQGPSESLTVYIVGARGLRNADWLPGSGSSDAYVILKMGGKELHRTEVVKDSLEPFWREEVLVRNWRAGIPLEFYIWDEDYGSSGDCLGKVILGSGLFDSVGFNGELPIAEAGRGVSAFLRLKVKLQGKDLPPGPPLNVLVSATRKGLESWGLDLDTQDSEHLFVTGVREGPFQDVNEKLPPDEQIAKGDFIIAVNHKRGDQAALLNQFKVAPEANVLLVRSVETTLMFNHRDEQLPLGLKYPIKPAGPTLVVLGVEPGGSVEAFNKSQENAMLRFHVSDRIVAVCGFRGKAHELAAKLEALTSRGIYQISVQRKPDELARQHFGLN